MLVVSLPEHIKSMIALEQDEHIMKNHEDSFFAIVSLLTDHLIRMMIAAFQDYSDTVKFWTQGYHDMTMVRFFRYTNDKFAMLRPDGIVYEDMRGL